MTASERSNLSRKWRVALGDLGERVAALMHVQVLDVDVRPQLRRMGREVPGRLEDAPPGQPGRVDDVHAQRRAVDIILGKGSCVLSETEPV